MASLRGISVEVEHNVGINHHDAGGEYAPVVLGGRSDVPLKTVEEITDPLAN
jgi:hypothetical protein